MLFLLFCSRRDEGFGVSLDWSDLESSIFCSNMARVADTFGEWDRDGEEMPEFEIFLLTSLGGNSKRSMLDSLESFPTFLVGEGGTLVSLSWLFSL